MPTTILFPWRRRMVNVSHYKPWISLIVEDDLLLFWLGAWGIHTPNFLILPTEFKFRTMVEWSQFITFASYRVHWRGSLWINVFKRSSLKPEGIPEREVSLMSKRSSLKRENHFLRALSDGIFPYTAQMFLVTSTVFAPQREEYVRNVPISPLVTPFCSDHGSTHYLQMTKLLYVNSSTTIELQIKNDDR